MFTRNLHYAASYWQEHGANFEAMVDQMMKEPTLMKVADNAEMMCLAFTERTKWLPAQYNKESIYPALGSPLLSKPPLLLTFTPLFFFNHHREV